MNFVVLYCKRYLIVDIIFFSRRHVLPLCSLVFQSSKTFVMHFFLEGNGHSVGRAAQNQPRAHERDEEYEDAGMFSSHQPTLFYTLMFCSRSVLL